MAFFVLMGLIGVLIVYISLAKKKKKAVLISVVILGAYFLYVRNACGPNSADVKVMKPMAEKISDYIVKHGVPESLKDIPDLPYGLVGCHKTSNSHEVCRSYTKDIKYNIELYAFTDNSYTLKVFRIQSNTGIKYYFDVGKNMKTTLEESGHNNPTIYSNKTSGICNPMRQ